MALEAEFARSEGDLDRAREIVERTLSRVEWGDEQRYRWPVLWLGARIEAERAVAARDAGGSEAADASDRMAALCQETAAMATTTAADRAHHALVEAESARMGRTGEAAAWANAVAACRGMNEPFPLAYALLRQVEALAAEGESEAAAASAQEGLGLAHALGAAPLAGEIEALIRRARLRIDLGRPGAGAPAGGPGAGAPAGESVPAEPARLGLTARESEVLNLVAEGYSNGQIAERLFISRKTAGARVEHPVQAGRGNPGRSRCDGPPAGLGHRT